ncbi:helicase associated domain-containing protein [Streptomyces sp. NPDC047082]|uniref:helicase associated domain-containing protein n=1 Tax=Streptomyces sp. NPDC047082 TaxID=3155259 RepID=UPI0033EC66EC
MVWDPTDAAWEENLAARAYYAETGTLAAAITATALDKPVGQWLANCRKKGGLGKNPTTAERREQQLAAIDEDRRPAWPIDWQRHYAAITQLDEIVPGVTAAGSDIGRWLERQRQHVVWEGLTEGQRERLTDLGVTPLPRQRQTPAKASRGSGAAFERGCAALDQYRARTGSVTVPRAHVERLEDGTEAKLGVSLSNTKTRCFLGGRPGARRPGAGGWTSGGDRHDDAAGLAGVPHGRGSPRSHGRAAAPPPGGGRNRTYSGVSRVDGVRKHSDCNGHDQYPGAFVRCPGCPLWIPGGGRHLARRRRPFRLPLVRRHRPHGAERPLRRRPGP